jgi:hypothetical protein
MECTYPSTKDDFQVPFVDQPAWTFLCKANVQGAHGLYKRVLLSVEALAYQANWSAVISKGLLIFVYERYRISISPGL